MKQTSLLAKYHTTTPKKSPLPSFNKLNGKSPFATPQGLFQAPLSTLSPMTKRNIFAQEETDENLINLIKSGNRNSKVRTRESFEGITQNTHKKLKQTKDILLEQDDEKITVRLPNSKKNSPILSNGHENTNEETESKENTETKANSFENISTSSPNSILEKDAASDSTRVSQVLKLLSNRKLNLEKDTSNTSSIKESAEKPKTGISLETLNILSQIKAKKDAAMNNNKSVIIEPTKMLEEKEEPAQVSESTLNLIKLLKTKSSPVKTAETEKPHADILSGPSIRERYGELIRAEREFVLPVIYKRLLEVFECFDKTINYFVNRGEPTFLRFILKSVEDTIRIRASETQLAQILYVLPNAYSLSWEKNDRFRGELDLYVKFANDENGDAGSRRTLTTQKIDERRAAFKDGLLRITKAHHAEFLKTLSEGERRKNYDEERCWNSKFKVHDCPVIPEGKMPARPHKENLKSVKEFLQLSETKDSRVRRIMEETVRAQEEKPVVAESKPVARQFRNISGLSDKLLSMVRAKEQALATESQQRLQTQKTEMHTIMQQELKKVAETIKVYYVQRSVSAMFFVNVVDHIVRNCIGLVLGQAEATKYIEELINLCPNWLSITGINGNRILKVDKSANMQIVFENIEKGKAN